MHARKKPCLMKSESFDKNLKEKSLIPSKCKSCSDIVIMNKKDNQPQNVSFSMIVDKIVSKEEYKEETSDSIDPYNILEISDSPTNEKTSSDRTNENNNSEYSDSNMDIIESEFDSDSDSDYDSTIENMMIGVTPPDPFGTIQLRTRLRWVDDGNVTRCHKCKCSFGMFVRRHHCVIEGTVITLTNGMGKKIEDMTINTRLPAWDEKNNNISITEPYNNAVLDQGYQPCLVLKLEDDRELIATSDHRVLVTSTINPTPHYVEMKDLNTSHRAVCFEHNQNYEGPEKLYYTLAISNPPTIYKNGEPQKVYDLSVPYYESFVANGIVVHNCRLCGDIFCGTCANKWDTIPECINHIPTSTGLKSEIDRQENVRLCITCSEKISLVKKLEILLKSIQMIEMDIFFFKNIGEKDMDISDSIMDRINEIPDVEKMSDTELLEFAQGFMNGKLWKQLANFYLSKFREIQYKLPYDNYTEWEKNALWSNYKHLKNHDIWMVHLIRAFSNDETKLEPIVKYIFDNNDNNDNNKNKDKDECLKRMCTRLCQPTLSWESSLMLLDILGINIKLSIKKIITKEVIKSFDKCDDKLLESILPCIIYRIIDNGTNKIRTSSNSSNSSNTNTNDDLVEFLMSRCSKSVRISNKFYWALVIEKENKKNNSYCDYLMSRLFREIPTEIYDLITDVNNFVHTISDNYNPDNIEEPISNLDKIGTCISPTNPEEGVRSVLAKSLPGENSANKPVPIILNNTNNKNSGDCDIENILLYKVEDLRTDDIVMSIIKMMKTIVEEEMEIDLHVITYDIQPTSRTSGFIAAVKDCQTLYAIAEKEELTLWNYIKKHNPDTPAKILSERFINSCAFYSVITFLLGIGDRHLDNIMLTKNGEIFHIDFGFILGKDPRPMKTPQMRITEGMLDAIGGHKSESYGEFKELCYVIYDILRRHVNTFVCMLSLLSNQDTGGSRTNPKVSRDRVLREIVKRFAPGETYHRAKTLLHTKIDKSTNLTNISKYHVVDFFHRHNKEGTIRNILSYTVGSTWSGTRNVVQGIWDYLSGS
jgi:hypothetical protein